MDGLIGVVGMSVTAMHSEREEEDRGQSGKDTFTIVKNEKRR